MKQLEEAGIEYEYEPRDRRIPYTVPELARTYLPDFVIRRRDGGCIYIESKGRWTYEDRYKHLLVRTQHPEIDIRFVFGNAKSRISKGGRTTYADICEGRGRGLFKGVEWKYSDRGQIPRQWFEE